MTEQDLPGLAAIGGLFRWLEELLVLVSGPLLIVGLGVALVDLLTDGKLLNTQPELLFAWAIAMAVGMDAQLLGASVKLGAAWQDGKYWRGLAYAALVGPLAYVAFVASQVFATQQAHGWTTAQALSALGMDGTTWLTQRSLLSVLLVVLSGALRYRRKRFTIEDEYAKLDRELKLEPLRAQVRMQKVVGMRGAVAAAVGKTPVEPPPTNGGTPAAASRPATDTPLTSDADTMEPITQPALRVLAPRTTAAERRLRQKRARTAGLRGAAFHLLDAEPDMSRKALRDALKCAQSVANQLYADWQQSRQREEVAQ